MLKTVNGVRCNTLTAKPLATIASGDDSTARTFFRETLYVNKFRNFFIHGKGNSASRYAEYHDGEYIPGEDIVALSFDEAAAWAKKHLPEDEYTKLFDGENTLLSTSTDKTPRTNLALSKAARAKLTLMSSRSGKTLSEIVSELIMSAN